MANTEYILFQTPAGKAVALKLIDNGDGTYSLSTASATGSAAVDFGTNGGGAPAVPTGGTGPLGWLASLVDSVLNGWAKTNIRKLTLTDDVVRSTPAAAANAPALSQVNASLTSVTIAAASTGRLGLIIVNTSASATLYLAYAATATLIAFTDIVLPGQTWVMPAPLYTGLISGIWDIASGTACVTNMT